MLLALIAAILGLVMLVVPRPFAHLAGLAGRHAGRVDTGIRILGIVLLFAALLLALAAG